MSNNIKSLNLYNYIKFIKEKFIKWFNILIINIVITINYLILIIYFIIFILKIIYFNFKIILNLILYFKIILNLVLYFKNLWIKKTLVIVKFIK